MMIERDVASVLSCYGLDGAASASIEALDNAGGWSGSRLWRLKDVSGCELCLRRWPAEHPTVERLRMIHAVLGLVAFELPIVAVPLRTTDGKTFIEQGGNLWELTTWRPGAADYHANPSRVRLAGAMRALAQFHGLAARYNRRLAVAPTILDRQKRWKGLQEKGLSIVEKSLRMPLDQEIDKRAGRLLALSSKALESTGVIQLLAAAPELWLQPAIRDIHHDHVLFTGDEVTGIIDFGAMRIDTPLADVARLVGSLVGDDREAREFALHVYSEMQPLSEWDRGLVELLDETGLVLGACQWLVWLYAERRDMGPEGPIVRRLDQILGRLEARAGGRQ